MRILLVSPRRPQGKHENFLNQRGSVFGQDDLYSGAGTGLLILAALTPADIEVEYIDDANDPVPYHKKYDLVAISAMTSQAIRAYEIAAGFRTKGIKTAIGGIHATLLPDEAMHYCDTVAMGEAEIIWPQMIADLRTNSLKPRYRAEMPCDLALSPIPRHDLSGKKPGRKYWVNTTRGCPFRCNFCCSSLVFGDKYRHRPIDNVVAEIQMIKEMHGKASPVFICFSDDNMFVDRARAREIVKRITPLKIKWFAQTDISISDDDELLAMLRESGCVMLFIGIESVNRSSLEGLNNRVKLKYLERYPAAIAKIQSHLIGVMGAFIIGLDEDDLPSFDLMSRFIIDNHVMPTQISILTPLPGTPLREQLARENRLLPTDWSHYTMTEVNYIPKNMTVDELSESFTKIYAAIYAEEVISANKNHFLMNALNRAAPPKTA